MALYSVTDWALYDNVYTERFMDTPAQNPEGYKNGSAMTFASQLKGKLFIVHGEMDDNVHMQNSFQLLNALLDLGQSVELMIYPGERHGVRGRKAVEEARAGLDFWKRHLLDAAGGPARQERPE